MVLKKKILDVMLKFTNKERSRFELISSKCNSHKCEAMLNVPTIKIYRDSNQSVII